VAFTISSNNIDEVSTQPLTTKTDEEKIFEGHPNDLLPRLAEVKDGWSLQKKGEKTDIEAQGLKMIYGKTYLNIGLFSATQLIMNIYQFDTPNNSKLHYDDSIATSIKKGSNVIESNQDDAECYGFFRSAGSLEIANFRCTKDNIYVTTYTASNELNAKNAVKKFMGIALDKIN